MFSLEELNYPLPKEIISKIIMYYHTVLKRNIQNDIIKYTFGKNSLYSNKRLYVNCLKCNCFHRRPKHFYC
jgi:hypothetical protein